MSVATRPSFVFIMTDSQGANVIGCYGDQRMQTPCVDKLATEGIRFARAYDACPVCTPARSAIFTGMYPHLNGAWANELALYADVKTMGQRFRDAGYDTAYIGKWHLSGQDYFDQGYAPDGWDPKWWYDGRNYLADLTDDEVRFWREEQASTESLLKHPVPREFTWANHISKRAIEFLQAEHDKPFVLVLSYDEPHGPCTCPAEYVERFKDFEWDPGPNKYDDLKNKPQMHRDIVADARDPVLVDGVLKYPPFFACNSYVDSEIGSVIDAVDTHAASSTVVIYTSDHGQQMGAHGMVSKGVNYEESIHIPLIIRLPDGGGAGRVEPTVVNHVDLLPTMLDMAGLEVPPIIDGRSLAPLIASGEPEPDRFCIIEWNRNDIDVHRWGLWPSRVIHCGRYKLAVNICDTDEFYDLQTDPDEMDNLIDSAGTAPVRDDMHDALLAWMCDHRDPFRGPEWGRRPWRTSPLIGALFAGAKPRPADGYSPPTLAYWTGRPYPGG